MSDWFVYQAAGNPVGPVSTDLLARGILAGKVPRESHVAAMGDSRWFPALAVPEITDALRKIESQPPPPSQPISSIPPAPAPMQVAMFQAPGPAPTPAPAPTAPAPAAKPPAPPPAAKPAAPPAAAAPAAGAAAPAAAAQPAAAAAAAAKKPALDPKFQKLPYVIFGSCAFVALILFVVGLVMKPAAENFGAGAPTTAEPAK